MTPLEANIVSMIPNLSQEAQDAISLALKNKPKPRKRRVVVTAEQARTNMMNLVLRQQIINRPTSDSLRGESMEVGFK